MTIVRRMLAGAALMASAIALTTPSLGFAQKPVTASQDSVATFGIPAGFSSRFATVNGVRLHYVIGGSGGTPILLIHGWPEDWYEWRKMLPLLAAKHTVIAVDLRGFGASDATPGGYSRVSLAEDLFQLMTQLGYPKAVLVGHDWGGPVAYAYAASHRDAVERLVVAEGPPDGPWTAKQTTPFLHNPFWFFGFFEVPDYAEKVLAGHEKEFLDWFYRNKGFHVVPGSFSDSDIEYYEETFARPGRLATSLQLYRTIDQDTADNTEFAHKPLTIPVLAIGAQRGVGARVPEVMHLIASDVTPVLLEDTGHFLTEERPEVFADLIERFLAGQSIAPSWKPETTPEK